MTKKIITLIGVMLCTALGWWFGNTYLQANLFAQEGPLTTEGAPVFIADNFVALPGDVGEVDVRIGGGLTNEVLDTFRGVSFTIDWNQSHADLLLADFSNTVFANSSEALLNIDRNTLNNSAQITITTAIPRQLRPGDSIVQLSFRLSNNLQAGDNVTLPLSQGEIAFEQAYQTARGT